MSKSDDVWNTIYEKHLNGGRMAFTNNPTDNRQRLIERMYERQITEMAMNRFKWIGLPSSVSERFLELTLFRNALSVFYYDEEYSKHLALRGAGNGALNMYDDPTSFLVTGNSTFTGKTLDKADCVPIWANYLRMPDVDIVLVYASKIAHIDRTIEINSNNARRSKVIVADQNSRLSVTNINNQIDKGAPAIYVNPNGAALVDQIQAVDMGIHPDTIVKLQTVRTQMWNECMGLLGLNFANQDKRERMVVDEVSANDEQIQNMRAVNLNARKAACVEINAKYDLRVDVKYRVDAPMPIESTGGEL